MLIVTSLANVVLVLVATRDGGRLMNGVHWRERGYRVTRAASAGLAFGAGLVLLYTGHSVLTVYCWVLIPVVLIVARLAFGESARRADAHT